MASPSTNTIILLLQLFAITTPAKALSCPNKCKCSWVLDSLEVNCSRNGLTAYPNFEKMPVEHLDLSGNYFVEFPRQLAEMESLIYLDLSDNQIEYLDADALLGFISLRTLLLANNAINSWININPNAAFRNAISLKRLSLSGNHLGSFTNDNDKNILVSESLNQLELEKCGITAASGDHVINGLPNLQRLILSGNSLNTISSLLSTSLRVLELSNCTLQRVSANLLESLPNLEALNLSWNSALQFGSKPGDFQSITLNELDVSYCNLDAINLSGLPSLATLHLRGNMLRVLSAGTFANNTQLEVVDVGRNSLRNIDVDAFVSLKRLSKLDLSYNEIARLDRNLFRSNDVLVLLNLSRNVIEKFTKLVSNSLRDINLSWCEIISMESTALSALTSLQCLDLSNNLIRDIPSGMRSETLKKLSLSNCRLSVIRNTTFHGFPELASLKLNGNRFTNPFPNEYFQSNRFLDELWIGDNPWICNCVDPIFMNFYDFLTAKPQKLRDKTSVRCAAPSVFYGQTWETACAHIWLPNGHTSTRAEKVWTTILTTLMVLGALLLLFSCFKKYMKSRKQQMNHREYRRNQDEMMEIRRQNQRILDQEGTPNAPSAFETNLPSYEDALLMPKLDRPVKSMLDLTASSRARKKLRRSRSSRTDSDQEDDELMLDNRQRFRSEELLSNRDQERTLEIGPSRRTGYVEYSNAGSRRLSIEQSRFPAAHLKSQNLQSAEQIGNFQSYENSPYSKRKSKIAEIPPFKRACLRSDSVEFLTDPEFDANSKPGSPFAKRKPKSMPPDVPIDQNSNTNLMPPTAGGYLEPAIEDYFSTSQKSNSTNGSDFQVVVEPDVASLLDDGDCSSSSAADLDLERCKRRKRKNSTSRRASGNFSAAAAAAADESSSSEIEPIVVVHKPMRETLF